MNKFDKFATTSGNFEEIKYSDMQHRKTYNYFNFQQNWVSRSVKTVHTNVFAKIISYIYLQIPIVFSKKSIISDKHHRITYMYKFF